MLTGWSTHRCAGPDWPGGLGKRFSPQIDDEAVSCDRPKASVVEESVKGSKPVADPRLPALRAVELPSHLSTVKLIGILDRLAEELLIDLDERAC
jgi:hypothetical protein